MKKIVMVILDGFGIRNEKKGNAVRLASTPVLDKLYAEFPHASLIASGTEVGLPKGQMGNSEVGHITLGSGRIVKQPLVLLNEEIKSKKIFENEVLLNVINHVKENNSSLHFVGLLSNGGVHSSITHFYAMLALAKLKKVDKVYFHFFTDGRDTSPVSGKKFVEEFQNKMEKLNVGKIGTIIGRYYAMDRDNRWDRTKKAYDMLVTGIGNSFRSAEGCLEKHYKNGVTDEFINPCVINKDSMIKENDGVIFLNFRPDRMKQLLDAFRKKNFKEFETKEFTNLKMASLFNIYKGLDFVKEMEEVKNTFGDYLDSLDFKQARIAETEKYAHVTYFFDGGRELKLKNCDKYLIPSPKVPTYDMQPEMNVSEVAETVINLMEEDYDFILVNFANPDMVGHTGNLEATIKSIEACDLCLGKIIESAQVHFFDVVVTSDHGNAEFMLDRFNNIITSHTTNEVPFIICNNDYEIKRNGSLKDVVPTLIDMYEIKKPDEMTGESLIKNKKNESE